MDPAHYTRLTLRAYPGSWVPDQRVDTHQCKGKHAKALEKSHNVRAIMLDTQGPEIRTGMVKGGGKIQLTKGSTIELTIDPVRHRREITRFVSSGGT